MIVIPSNSKEYAKKYYQLYKEQKYWKDYYKLNKEKIKADSIKYRNEHPEVYNSGKALIHKKEIQKAYYLKHQKQLQLQCKRDRYLRILDSGIFHKLTKEELEQRVKQLNKELSKFV